MYRPGTKVICTRVHDEAADGRSMPSMALLTAGIVYMVVEFDDPSDCKVSYSQQPFFQENGGRMVLQELPGLVFFGRRFEEVTA